MNDKITGLTKDLNPLLVKISGFGYLPRWAVFGMDVLILVFADFFKHILVSPLTDFSYDTLDSYSRYSLFIGVNVVFFLVFRTYSGIVRHSSFLDGLKLLLSTFCALITLIALDEATF